MRRLECGVGVIVVVDVGAAVTVMVFRWWRLLNVTRAYNRNESRQAGRQAGKRSLVCKLVGELKAGLIVTNKSKRREQKAKKQTDSR